MKNKTIIAAIFIVGLIIVVSGYGVYNAYFAASDSLSPTIGPAPTVNPFPTSSASTVTASPADTVSPTKKPSTPNTTPVPTSAPTSITVTDANNKTMTIPLPVKTIAVLDSGVAEILCAMGCQSLIVARTTSCNTPPTLLNIPTVGENDYSPNVEKLIQLDPDIIFASSMLPYNPTAYQQLLNAGIPVYIVDTTSPEPTNPSTMTKDELYALDTPIDFTCNLMKTLIPIVGHESEATKYIEWAQHYNKLVKDRIYTLSRDQMPKVFLEWYSYPYQTFSTASVYQAGGINIAENETDYSGTLSPEFVVQKDPEVIIELIYSSTHDLNDFISARNDIMSREATKDTTAIKNGRVYICDFHARSGIRSVIGYLYWAKWVQPSLFVDINPATVNQELNQKFFGTDITGTFAYP